MRVHLVDGTYELFRQFYGQPARPGSDGNEVGAARGVVLSMMGMLANGATHLGVATDHVIESFRNGLWPGYKDGASVPPELLAQFELLESALTALGVAVWPMVELEADDALASAAAIAASDPKVEQVVICTPDKDLSQCVVDDRVVQLDRRTGVVRNEAGVWEKFGVAPSSIPDWLALVGDSADGFPGLDGWGPRSAAVVLAHYDSIDRVPDEVDEWDPPLRAQLRGANKLATKLSSERGKAELFRTLATLRTDAQLFKSVEELRWRGPTAELERVASHFRDPSMTERALKISVG